MDNPIRPTTIIKGTKLDSLLDTEIILASETFQVTGSFKFRAAYNLANSAPNKLFITASSGNFGQAMACATQLIGKQCIVVMPKTAATIKIDAVKKYGAEVVLVNASDPTQEDFTTRAAALEKLSQQHPDAYISNAYDDPFIIEGNSTLGVELAQISPAPDFIIAPVGGGGLSSGIITGLKKAGANIPVIGAEPLLANDAARSLKAGEIIANESEPLTVADGARTLSLGMRNWEILKDEMQTIIEVSDEQIQEGLRMLFQYANLKSEPTGALAIGAILAQPEMFRGKRVCCVISGANVDPEVYIKILGSNGTSN